MQNNNLLEGLRPLDLENLISNRFEIDTYRSKMGEDKDVVVMSLTSTDRNSAKDLMEFVEKGYNFVLDADVSSGEDNDGNYKIFIEISRTPQISENILELTSGLKKLTGISEWKFKYHKKSTVHEVTVENLKNYIPSSPAIYESFLHENKTESIRSFFNKTLMDDITLSGNEITIHKPFNKQIKLRWLNEDDSQSIVEDSPTVDDHAAAEIFWLTKVLGNYDISKFGDKFLFTNGDRTMLLQRID